MDKIVDLFPVEANDFYWHSSDFDSDYENTHSRLVVKYLKEGRVDFGRCDYFDCTTLSEQQQQTFNLFRRFDSFNTRNLFKIYVLEHDDYIIYMLVMSFGHTLGQYPVIMEYLSKFQTSYLTALEKQIGLPINITLDGSLQVLFVYDKLRAVYCSFEQFTATEQQGQQQQTRSDTSYVHL